ncbi:MAG: rhodanese-like domain-containing protein [Deltaproteobacteria bacterium]|nr:rhodanese-like domain-containing protein [Deltaproteobacteria bacterium]
MEIITYCEGIECSSAEDLSVLLKEIGYEDVKVFTGGWEEWTENGMPVDEEGG